MINTSEDNCVVTVRCRGRISWFRSPRDLWVLDLNKWRSEFIAHGYSVPEFAPDFRFGILSVNYQNAQKFLNDMKIYEVKAEILRAELTQRYAIATSWWDVADLFPIMFVDFDRREVAAFYCDGTPMERYLPDGWVGKFIDFSNEYSEDIFPLSSKFWIDRGINYLAALNAKNYVTNTS